MVRTDAEEDVAVALNKEIEGDKASGPGGLIFWPYKACKGAGYE